MSESYIAWVSAKNWEQFCRDYPKTGPIRRQMAAASALMAQCPPSHPAHAAAQDEYHDLERRLGPSGRFGADA
jgi:hypothetical protein